MRHVNLFKVVFRTVIFLVVGSTAFAIYDYTQCDGPVDRCDNKAEIVRVNLMSLVPVFIAWIAPSDDGEFDDQPPSVASRDLPWVPPSSVGPEPSPEAAWPSFETRSRSTPSSPPSVPPDPDNA